MKIQRILVALDASPHSLAALEAAIDLAERLDACLLYTSDAADERSSVDLGGRRIIKKKKKDITESLTMIHSKKRNRKYLTTQQNKIHRREKRNKYR